MVIEQSNVLILIHSSLFYLHFPTQPALKLIASQIDASIAAIRQDSSLHVIIIGVTVSNKQDIQ